MTGKLKARWRGTPRGRSAGVALAVIAALTAVPAAATAAPGGAGVRADFNGDGYTDLAVGVPYERIGTFLPAAGAVNVVYGSAAGLSGGGSQLLDQDVLAGSAGAGDSFGSAVAAGDFNGDGRADLAIGVPGETVNGRSDAGAINVVYGSAAGLSLTGDQIWDQSSLADVEEVDDEFGSTLAAGDFNGDGRVDLAVGVPGERVGETYGAGAVNVVYGSVNGLSATGNQIWNQDALTGVVESYDHFGSALAAGDLDGDGRADLAVGVPFDDIGTTRDAGTLNVIYGGSAGLTAGGNQLWDQRQVIGATEEGDRFGAAVTAGDFNRDGRADVAVGVPGEAVGSANEAGAVNVIYGSGSGLGTAGNQLWDQSSLVGAVEGTDRFGAAVTAGDFNGDGRADLAVGAPGEDVGGTFQAGAVNVIYGSGSGLGAAGNRLWDQSSLAGAVEEGDVLGLAVAAGDFNGDGRADLAAGAPGEDIGDTLQAGAVNVIYGSAAGLSAGGNQLWDQPALGGEAEQVEKFGSTLAAG
ncbi:hypothetical protein ACIBSW_22275 [Actinoplanes sp. NPDC049668]|uniref:hypothetical protein n=1 Tax=unclassified Actinoplanes TaxID=2626549 RepID=UPI0033BF0C4F